MPPKNDATYTIGVAGEDKIIAALGKVEKSVQRSADRSAQSFNKFNSVLSGTQGLMLKLGAVVSVGALVAIAKQANDAADQVGKMSQRVGASVENFHALSIAAATADVPVEGLQKAMFRLNVRLSELRSGEKGAVAAFKAIGLGARDFAGKDSAESIGLVAEAFGRLRDSPEKSARAFGIFGKAAGDLIPLLNDLSETGLQGAIDRARELGIVFTEDTARAAQAINDDFTILSKQTQNLAQQFLEGLAPALHAALTDVSTELGQNSSGFREWGQKVGEFVATAVLGAENFIDRLITSFRKLLLFMKAAGQALVQPFAAGGFFTEANTKAGALESQFRERENKRLERAERVGERVAQGAGGLPALRAGTQDEDAQAQVRERNLDREAREIERLEEQRAGFIRRQAEAEGKRHEQALRDIDAEVAKYDEVLGQLEARGRDVGDRQALVQQLREALEAAEGFRQLSADSESELTSFLRDRASIEAQVGAGLLSQVDAEQQLLALERERLPGLKQTALALLNTARATGDPQAVERASAFIDQIAQIELHAASATALLQRLQATARGTLAEALANAFTNAVAEGERFLDVLRNIGLAVVQAVQQLLALELAKKLVSFIPGFSEGGAVGQFADGGLVSGPGGPTADAIPARLSAGEFVMRAAAVGRPGALAQLEAMNRAGGGTPALRQSAGVRRYAGGGLVVGAGVARADSSLTVGLEDGLVLRHLETAEGQRAVLQVLAKNPRAARNAVGNG